MSHINTIITVIFAGFSGIVIGFLWGSVRAAKQEPAAWPERAESLMPGELHPDAVTQLAEAYQVTPSLRLIAMVHAAIRLAKAKEETPPVAFSAEPPRVERLEGFGLASISERLKRDNRIIDMGLEPSERHAVSH